MSEVGKFQINDVVQFTENHKWCGCFGYIDEVKKCGNDIRYMIGVPMPEQGTAYIFSMESDNDFEYVGDPVLVVAKNAEEDEKKHEELS